MVNLIIDFNNIAMRAMNACIYMRDSGVSNYDTQEECNILARKITTDISHILRMFCPDRTIFACDAKHPWREDVYDSIPDMKYKGNRVKDESKNWNNIFRTINDLKDIYGRKGFIVCEIERTEADDIAALYKKTLYTEKTESVIFVSSDRDWCQLVDYDSGGNRFCIVYNPIVSSKGKKKLYSTNACSEWINAPEITNIFFNNYSKEKELLRNILKDAKNELDIIDPEQVLIEKIVCGDDGDNVPGFYDFYSKGKRVRFTPLRMKKLFESAGLNDFSGFKVKCIDGSIRDYIGKLFKREVNDVDTNERLMRQRKLVELNPDLFPADEVNTFESKFAADTDTLKGRIGNVSAIKMEDILSGTEYISENYVAKPRENSIFNDLKDAERFLKPLF